MNALWRRGAILATLLMVLAAVNLGVRDREALLANGDTLFLELAPVDPRSMMQGDYMALRFAIADAIHPAQRSHDMHDASPSDGIAVVKRDARGVGKFARIHSDASALASGETLLRYRIRKNSARIVTNAWFFQEGTGAQYDAARFGEFRVAPDGEALLVAMRDKDLKVIGGAIRK
jgi:uncharacterized membrane-anchored protein